MAETTEPAPAGLISLTGQTAVVTGAGSPEGIGFATARSAGPLGGGGSRSFDHRPDRRTRRRTAD